MASSQGLPPIKNEGLISNEKSYDNEPDETWMERFVGLKEMFPAQFLTSSYFIICDASWIFFTTIAMVFGPVLFENERQRVEKDESNNYIAKSIVRIANK